MDVEEERQSIILGKVMSKVLYQKRSTCICMDKTLSAFFAIFV